MERRQHPCWPHTLGPWREGGQEGSAGSSTDTQKPMQIVKLMVL